MTDPRRLLDNGSDASPALRALLASAKRDDDPRAAQVEALSARLAAAMAPVAPAAPIAPAPHVIASAAARASHAAVCVKAGAAIVALGVLCAGALYVRVIRDDARTRAETSHAIEVDARQSPTAVAPQAPDHPSIENAVPRPSPAPSLDVASAPAPPATSPKQKRGSGDSDAEAKLVLTAGAALVRDDAETALALTREHGARFPNGAHAEERDRIAIEALVRLRGLEDARLAGDRFFVRYPQSIYRARIEGLLR
jgi:hypothetical protein